jgi:hypothetical protein
LKSKLQPTLYSTQEIVHIIIRRTVRMNRTCRRPLKKGISLDFLDGKFKVAIRRVHHKNTNGNPLRIERRPICERERKKHCSCMAALIDPHFLPQPRRISTYLPTTTRNRVITCLQSTIPECMLVFGKAFPIALHFKPTTLMCVH